MRKMFLRLGTLSICLGLMIAFGASTAFAGTTPAITNIAHKNAVNRVLVEFNAPVWGDTAFTTALAAADFQLGGTCGTGVTAISSVTHAAGDDWAVLNVNGTVVADMSAGSCTIAAVANSIFTVGGALSEKTLAWDGSADATGPTISSVTVKNTETDLMVTLDEHAFSVNNGTGALVDADFTFADVSGSILTLSAAADELHVAGNDWVVLQGTNAAGAGDTDVSPSTLNVTTGVFDVFGNASTVGGATALTADAGAPAFATHFVATKGEATVGGTKILVKFSEPVFDAATPALADLVNDDFAYTDTTETTRVLSGTAVQTNDQQYVLLTVNSAFVVADLTVATADTIDEALNAIYDAFGNAKNEAAIALQDNTDPVLLSLAYTVNAGGQNQFILTYSEKVTITGLATGGATMAASTTTVGDTAAVGELQGFGDFATNGTITVPTTKNTLAIDSTQNIITVTMAGASGGYIATSTTTITVPSGVFTPEITGAGIKDLRPAADTANDIEITSTQSTLTTTTTWDTTRPTISSGVLSDTYYNNAAFVAGGTFNAGGDGKADQVIFTASEALRGSTLTPDAAGTRNDWAITAAVGEFGNSLTVIKAAPVTAGDTGTTYTINFSGAQSYYADPSTFRIVNTQDTVPSFTDRAGNPVASGFADETYRICFTGLTCSGSTIGNVAVITNGITQPSAGGNDTTGPAAPAGFEIELNASLKPVLTWTDPTDSDFSTIQILKSKGDGVAPTVALDTVAKGVKTFTDNSAVLGEILNYILKPFDSSGNAGTATSVVSVTVEEPEAAIEPVTVDLTAVGDSGQSGTATLTEADGQTTVEVALTGATGTQQSHIHSGTCTETGDVAHALTDLVDGASTTVLEMTLAELEAEGPNYINVHDATDATVSTACGDLYASTTPTPEEVAAPEETVEGVTPDETGTVAEETTVQGTGESAYATVSAGTALTTADGTPYTGTFTPPTAKEGEVTPPEGAAVASDIYSIGSGDEGVTITASQPVTVYLPVKAGFTASTSKVYKIFKLGSDEPSATCSVVTSEGATLFKCELTSFSDYVILEFAAEEEVDAGAEEDDEEDMEEAPFTDISSHWAKDFIADLYAKAIVTGKTATTYAPNDDVTRAEFTKIIVGAFDLDMVSTTGSFTDISGHWGSTYIEAAKAAGITGGYSDKTFRPNAKITRAEALKILLEAADVSLTAAAADFSDVKSSDWFAKYVNYASANDIVKGYADGTFGPNRNITRGEVAKIVSLMIAE